MKPTLTNRCVGVATGISFLFTQVVMANPTGGNVTSGSAGISSSGTTVTVNQTTDRAVINWQGFSIAAGELTKFVQPSATSAVLNRVVGGNISSIYGTLQANGQVYLINPNGIAIGPTGIINTAGFTASTLNVSDQQFMAAGTLEFSGSSAASVVNLGSINAGGGNIFLIAQQVENDGILHAGGVAGLAAGTDVYLSNGPGERLLVQPAAGTIVVGDGVVNKGSIQAAQVELNAAAGNIYAFAIRNDGQVRATGSTTIAGRIWLTAAGGEMENSGTVQATQESGNGGDVEVDANLLFNTGTLDASGKTGGVLGITADNLINSGTVSTNGTSGAGGQLSVSLSDSLMQTEGGSITANGHGGNGGSVTVQAGDGSIVSTPAVPVANELFLSGTISATGTNGGAITLLGQNITLAAAQVDASSNANVGNGGTVKVGADLHGAGTLPHSQSAIINQASVIKANAGLVGSGGEVVVWGDKQALFAGTILIKGGAYRGNGGVAEVSSPDGLGYWGVVNASAPHGQKGSVLLDPKNIIIDSTASSSIPQGELIDPHPTSGNGFGQTTIVLGNGQVLVTATDTSLGSTTNVGAVYIYDEATGGLVVALTGSQANDQVGSGGIEYLTGGGSSYSFVPEYSGGGGSGNILIFSPHWNNGTATNAGAVTFVDISTALTSSSPLNGPVSAANSLVGSHTNDYVGSNNGSGSDYQVLDNGNYLIFSPGWSGSAGAITLGSGTSGITGTVGTPNSLVGTSSSDNVGNDTVEQLSSGNLLIFTPNWGSSIGQAGAGAVTWMNGSTGALSDGSPGGAIGQSDSLVGSSNGDQVGNYSGYASYDELGNGNVVVLSQNWGNGAGAVTWMNGSTGALSTGAAGGVVDGTSSSPNSLIGSTSGDNVGSGTYHLSNGNIVVLSPNWNNGAGAVTWMNGSTGALNNGTTGGVVDGTSSNPNSLIGSTSGDNVGGGGIVYLSQGSGGDGYHANSYTENVQEVGNGNFIVLSPNWSNGAGAVTWVDGSTGKLTNATTGGVIDGTSPTPNSLIGSSSGDGVGGNVEVLSNGNYVVISSNWNNGAGAITWGDGSSGALSDGTVGGMITSGNSLIGNAGDQVGSGGEVNLPDGSGGIYYYPNVPVQEVANGNFIVVSPQSGGGAGAVTWVNGSNGQLSDGVSTGGTVGSSNSVVGSGSADSVNAIVQVLSNGNYVLISPSWSAAGFVPDAGAVTWVDGSSGALSDGTTGGVIGASNSLVGSNSFDSVGSGGTQEAGGGSSNFIVVSPQWGADTGAVTWMDASTGALSNGNAGGAVDGTSGTPNSLIGSYAGDGVNLQFDTLNGSSYFVIITPNWSNGGGTTNAGAVTVINGSNGALSDTTTGGVIGAGNSLVGGTTGDNLGSGGIQDVGGSGSGNFVVQSPDWSGTAGAVTFESSSEFTAGAVTSSNSLVGSNSGDLVGNSVQVLSNGDYVVISPTWSNGAANPNSGAVTWGDGTSGIAGPVSSSNSLVGSTSGGGDKVGSSGIEQVGGYTSGNFVVRSPDWNGTFGAVTFETSSAFMTGAVTSRNSLVGGTSGDRVGNNTVQVLGNGNYVVVDSSWSNYTGAVTWVNGSNGQLSDGISTGGTVSAANSVVGSSTGDQVGSDGFFSLTNDNYVIQSPLWSNSTGAVTWVNGATGALSDGTTGGVVGTANSVLGASSGEGFSSITSLYDTGNFVVSDTSWGGSAGAVTWVNGATGALSDGTTGGIVSAANSLVGSNSGDLSNSFIHQLSNGNYVVVAYGWSNNTGAVTLVNGSNGLLSDGTAGGVVSSVNSLTGSASGDEVGYQGIIDLENEGNFLVLSPNWNAGTGAVTFVDGTAGTSGVVSSSNSVTGGQTSSGMGTVQIDYSTQQFYVPFFTDTTPMPGTSTPAGGHVRYGDALLLTGTSFGFNDFPGATLTISTAALEATLANSDVTLQANNDITLDASSDLSWTSGSALNLYAGRSILLNSSINTGDGELRLTANDTVGTNSTSAGGVVDAYRDLGAAVITMASGTTINTGAGGVHIYMQTGPTTNNTSGNITLQSVTGASVVVQNFAAAGTKILLNGDLTATSGGVDLTGSMVLTNSVTISGYTEATLTGTLDGTTAGAQNLTVDVTSSAGTLGAGGDVGATTRLGTLTINDDSYTGIFGFTVGVHANVLDLNLSNGAALGQTSPIDVGTLTGTVGGPIILNNASNQIGQVSNLSSLADSVTVVSKSALTLSGTIAGTTVTIGTTGGDLTLASGTEVTASAGQGESVPGVPPSLTDITLYSTTGNFLNNAGPTALDTGALGRFLVYAYSEAQSDLGGLSVPPTGIIVGQDYPGTPPATDNAAIFQVDSAAPPTTTADENQQPFLPQTSQNLLPPGGNLEGEGIIVLDVGLEPGPNGGVYVTPGTGYVSIGPDGTIAGFEGGKAGQLLDQVLGADIWQDLETLLNGPEGPLVTTGYSRDFTSFTMVPLADGPPALVVALSDEAEAELRAAMGLGDQATIYFVIPGGFLNIGDGSPLPPGSVPPQLVVALGAQSLQDLEKALGH